VFVAEVRDVIAEPRYDTVTLPTAGIGTLTFFSVPIGQGQSAYGAAGVAKTAADTNMELAGQLPNPYAFTILAFRMMPSWNITANDLRLAFNGCVFQLVIGAKPFLRVPARTIPQGNGPSGSGTDLNSNGFPSMSNSFGIGRKPLTLSPTENFTIQMLWPGLIVAVTTVIAGQGTAGLPITIFQDGFLKRGAQ
jgi:hypothetical protein